VLHRYIIILAIIEVLNLSALQADTGPFFLSDQKDREGQTDSLRTIKKSDKYLGPDKSKHFTASMISSVFFYRIFENQLKVDDSQGKIYSISFTLSLGVAKELYDKSRPGNYFSWKDILADLTGIAVGVILINQP